MLFQEGSGSHLMAYVNAFERKWDLTQLKFTVVGDVYGGLWSLKEHEAQGFLWEKYTTQPFVDQEKCRRVGEVKTPWPCFVIAVNNKFLDGNKYYLHKILKGLRTAVNDLKSNPQMAVKMISQKYQLKESDVKEWFAAVEWENEEGFKNKLNYYEGTVVFVQKVKFGKQKSIIGSINYQICDPKRCLPPTDYEFNTVVK